MKKNDKYVRPEMEQLLLTEEGIICASYKDSVEIKDNRGSDILMW